MVKSEIEKIIFPIENDLNIFEKKLYEIIERENNFLKKDLLEFMFSSPKRLRVIFVFLFSKILKIENENVLKIALSTELIHSASLIHDDILDNEEKRRGDIPLYKKFGAKTAVLEGDLLLSSALKILSETNLEILKIFSSKIYETISGEIEQNENVFKNLSEEKYLDKTFKKTGNIFLAGLESLFTLGSFEDDLKNNLLNFLKNYTIAFQIKNDIENLKTNKSDIKNGNYTLSVIYFLKENSFDDLNNLKLFEKYIEKAQKKVDDLKNLSIEYIRKTENSKFRNSLEKLCEITLRS